MLVLMAEASPARASADELVVRDSHIRSVHALDDMLVYRRFERRGKQRKWTWRRLVGGRVLPARGVPPGSRVGTTGRDRAGRVVLTMPVVERRKGGRLGYKWWIYDVARDRSRRLHGLRHGGCEPHSVSVWRNRLAHAASCKRRSKTASSCARAIARAEPRASRTATPMDWCCVETRSSRSWTGQTTRSCGGSSKTGNCVEPGSPTRSSRCRSSGMPACGSRATP